jgi:hypothetical protein
VGTAETLRWLNVQRPALNVMIGAVAILLVMASDSQYGSSVKEGWWREMDDFKVVL